MACTFHTWVHYSEADSSSWRDSPVNCKTQKHYVVEWMHNGDAVYISREIYGSSWLKYRVDRSIIGQHTLVINRVTAHNSYTNSGKFPTKIHD